MRASLARAGLLVGLAAAVAPTLGGRLKAQTEPTFRPLGVNDRGAPIFERSRDRARVVWIAAGPFRQNDYFPRATIEPQFATTSVEAFAIDETEVTNRQFAAFLNALGASVDERGRPLALAVESGLEPIGGDGGDRGDSGDSGEKRWRPQPGCEELPALGVTGFGALAYARWVGGDLPRLDEWQKAASGPDGLQFPWGDERPDATRANWRRGGPDRPMPVGSYPAGRSPYGLFDMAGNVYERVYAQRGRRGEPVPAMIRGGSWASPSPLNLRTFDLCMQPMEVAERTVGFRCVVREGRGLPDRTAPTAAAEPLRTAHSWRDAWTEAHERNVPILLSLQYDTCGQCDRTRVGLFRDPEFVRFVNEHAVLAVGHVPWDAEDDPHPEGADGHCSLYPELACHEHIELFYEGLQRVSGFSVSPGNFVLDPRVDDESRDAAKWILVGERELPKWGGGTRAYIAGLTAAQERLGAAKSRAEWLQQQPEPAAER